MATFNAEIFIKKAIESVLMQSFKDFELLISDDGSTDRTLAICKEYADKDSRIKIFKQKERLGEHHNKSFLVHQASGAYFKLLDQDDYLEGEDFLENHYSKLKEGYDYIISNVDVEETDQSIGTVSRRRDTMDCFLNCKTRYDFTKSSLQESAMIFYGVFKKGEFKKIHDRLLLETKGQNHFIDGYFVHSAAMTLKGYYLPSEKFVYSIHGKNISRSSPPEEFFPSFLFYIWITLKLFIGSQRLSRLEKMRIITRFISARSYTCLYYFYFSYIRKYLKTN